MENTAISEATNIETVQRSYEAFGRGDIDAILEICAEDVRWEHHPTGNTAQDQDVPYMRSRSGRDVVAGFFRDMEEDFEMHSFNPRSFLAGDGLVAAVVEFELTVKATGKRIHDEEIHLYEFGPDGKVTAFRHFLDTAKNIEAHL
jgi:ketosteroid isomerase-like protein